MKRIHFIFILTGLILSAFCKIEAQQVIAPSGGTHQNTSGTLSFTLGELQIDTKTNANGIITQGFHQANLTVTAIKELSDRDFSIIAYPNPATNVVFVKTEKGNFKKLSYSLFDTNGKLLLKNSTKLNNAEVSFETFTPAVYYLQVTLDGKDIKTFRIVKK
jgi:hypothetical protein